MRGDLNSIDKEAVKRCANIQLKYRYEDFLSKDNEDYPEFIGVWHPKVRELVRANNLSSKGLEPLFP